MDPGKNKKYEETSTKQEMVSFSLNFSCFTDFLFQWVFAIFQTFGTKFSPVDPSSPILAPRMDPIGEYGVRRDRHS